MKLLTGILGLTLTGVAALASANAADEYPITEGIDWSGPYAGVNIGGAWGNLNTNDVDGLYSGGASPGQEFGNNSAGVFGGAQLGYNFQRGSLVIGPEVDLGGIDVSNKKWSVPGFADGFDSGFYADVTGRLGLTVGQGLLYAKGGYVYFSGSDSHFDAAPPTSTSTTGLSGWTFGGGYEYKINPAWSVKGEYLHSDFGINTLYDTNPNCPAPTCPIKDGLTLDTLKLGVNYFVNSGYVPLK